MLAWSTVLYICAYMIYLFFMCFVCFCFLGIFLFLSCWLVYTYICIEEPQVCVSVLFDGSITLSLRNIEAHQSASPLKIYINGVLCNDSNASALYTLNIDDTVMIDTFQYCFIVKGDVDDDEDYSHVDYSGFQGKQAPKKKCETIDEVLREVGPFLHFCSCKRKIHCQI